MSHIDDILNSMSQEERDLLLDKLIKDKDKPKKVSEDFTMKPKGGLNKRKPVTGGKNTWTDIGEAKDPEFDPKKFEALGKAPRGTRAKPKKVEKTCSACGKTFKIDSQFVYGEFLRCDRCGRR